MPKMKSHTGAGKRIRKLKSGLFKAGHTRKRHKLMNRTKAQKRKFNKAFYVDCVDLGHIKQLFPY